MYDPRIYPEPTIFLDHPAAWLLALAALAGAFWLTRRYPDRGLVLVLAALPLYQVRGSIGPLPTTFLELLLLTVLAAVLTRWSWPRPSGLLPMALAVWTAAGLLAAVMAPDLREGLGLWRAFFLEPSLWLAAATAVFAKRNPRPLLWGALGAIGLLTAWTIGQLIGGTAITHDDRLLGPYQTPNYLALILVPLTLLVVTWPRRELIAVRLVAAAVAVGGLVATNSRGGQLALAAGLVVSLAFLRGRRLKQASVALAVAAVVAVAVLGPRLVQHPEEPVVSARPVIWREAVAIIKENPWLGNGPGQFQDVFTERVKGNQDHLLYVAPQALNPHNLGLVLWAEWGMLALLGWLGVLVAFGMTVWRRRSYWQIVPVSMMAAILVHGVVDTPVLKNDLAILTMTALGLAAIVPLTKSRRIG